LAEYEKKLEEAAKEAKQVLEEAREAAGRAREEIVSEARQAAATLKAQAEKDIATAREKAIADIKGQIVEVAMAVSESVLKKAVDQSDHERLTDEVLSRSKGIVG
ncbi:MAG: ATP synthase F0 subunit B, partial [Planctomycetota bacterium]